MGSQFCFLHCTPFQIASVNHPSPSAPLQTSLGRDFIRRVVATFEDNRTGAVSAAAALEAAVEFGLTEETLHCIRSLGRQRDNETALIATIRLSFNPLPFEKAVDPAQDR